MMHWTHLTQSLAQSWSLINVVNRFPLWAKPAGMGLVLALQGSREGSWTEAVWQSVPSCQDSSHPPSPWHILPHAGLQNLVTDLQEMEP